MATDQREGSGRRRSDRVLDEVRVRHEKDRRRWLAAYVGLVVVAVVGFYLTNAVNEARIYEQCRSSNEARKGIRDYIHLLTEGDGEITPREEIAIQRAEEVFRPLQCPPQPRFFVTGEG